MQFRLKKHGSRNDHKCQTTIYLNGGLGNQLFQLAFGIEISRARKSTLYLNTTQLDLDIKRNYSLDVFGFPQNESFEFSGSRITLISQPEKCNCEPIEIRETNFFYSDQSGQFLKNGNLSVSGYWQSPLYFEKNSDLITNFLNQWLSPQIETNYAVMHIRRGDFLNDTRTHKFHGILDIDYYARAVKLISKEVKKVYLISDNFKEATKILIQISDLYPGIEFILTDASMSEVSCISLMAHANVAIIANSSFSWWASYLGLKKSVIAPRRYFSEKTLRINNISDLYPSGWILI